MSKPRLYLMVGYPGAGKTTVSRLITERTGAVHLWADVERHKLFDTPDHSQTESRQLYDRLNRQAGDLLDSGKSVVFDTSFNRYHDRKLLRQISEKHNADTLIVWVATLKRIARDRAVHANIIRNGYGFTMTNDQFNTIASKLEQPRPDEKTIKIDGAELDADELVRLISA
jgi:predicted kinase